MLPAPASIAAAPSPRSSVSCNPAVPPPPVTGAALGIGLADEVAVAVAVLVTVAVAVAVPVGEKTAGGVEDGVDVHAETATGASRVRAPQHVAVSLARSGVPAIVLRTFMDPPHAPGR